jgi:hypothetical protein
MFIDRPFLQKGESVEFLYDSFWRVLIILDIVDDAIHFLVLHIDFGADKYWIVDVLMIYSTVEAATSNTVLSLLIDLLQMPFVLLF